MSTTPTAAPHLREPLQCLRPEYLIDGINELTLILLIEPPAAHSAALFLKKFTRDARALISRYLRAVPILAAL
jgi:hypothetical protein